MTLVSSRVNLTHRCTILRDASAATTDGWNQPLEPSWQPHLIDRPCRGWIVAGREAIRDTASVVVEDRRLIVTLETDVTDRDQISQVTDRGATVLDGPMRIDAIIRRPDRLELILKRIG